MLRKLQSWRLLAALLVNDAVEPSSTRRAITLVGLSAPGCPSSRLRIRLTFVFLSIGSPGRNKVRSLILHLLLLVTVIRPYLRESPHALPVVLSVARLRGLHV